MKDLQFNKKTGAFVRREEINVGDAKEAGEIRQALKIELAGIVRQVKELKRRADEIKEMLAVLDSFKEAEPKDSAPDRPAP